MILYENPMWKGIVRLSLPVFFVNILKTIHDLVDGVFLGQLEDGTSLQSAVALSWPVYFVFMSFGLGLSVAGNALIGQYIGSRDSSNAHKYAMNVVVLALILGLSFNIFIYFSAPLIFNIMGAESTDYTYAVTYMRIRSFELNFLFLSFAFQAIRQSTGDTVKPMIINGLAVAFNIALTPLLILVFDLGIAGAALATLIAHGLMTPFIIYYLFWPKNGIRLEFKKEYLDVTSMKDIMKVAMPASAGQSIQAIGFVILNSLIYSFGNSVSAAFYIGNRINMLVMFPAFAVGQIVSIYVAQNIGAKNIPRAKESIKTGLVMSIAIMVASVLVIIPFRIPLVNLFNNDADTIGYAAEYTLILILGLPLMAVFQVLMSTFQGAGETKYAFGMAVTRLWIFRLPLVLFTMHLTGWGPRGVWFSMLASNLFIVGVGGYFYKKLTFEPKIRHKQKKREVAIT